MCSGDELWTMSYKETKTPTVTFEGWLSSLNCSSTMGAGRAPKSTLRPDHQFTPRLTPSKGPAHSPTPMEWARVPAKPYLNFSPGLTNLLKSARTWVGYHWLTPCTQLWPPSMTGSKACRRSNWSLSAWPSKREASRGKRKSKPHLMEVWGKSRFAWVPKLLGPRNWSHERKTVFPWMRVSRGMVWGWS